MKSFATEIESNSTSEKSHFKRGSFYLFEKSEVPYAIADISIRFLPITLEELN
jgi:hypothetical protein